MKRRILSIFAVFLVMVTFLSVSAFASDGSDSSGGFGDAILKVFSNIWDFIKYIFIPSDSYFKNEVGKINALVDDRFGGIAYLYHMLRHFFDELKSVSSSGIVLKLPNNFLYSGYQGTTIDVLYSARPFVSFLRTAFTSFYFILISVSCYHKLRTFFNEQE